MTIRTSELRQFQGKNFRIDKIYNDYRFGVIDLGEGKNPRYIARTFKWFGKADDEVLYSGTERIKDFTKEYEISAGRELREQIWVNGVAEFHKVKEKLDRAFWNTWKKVFDIQITLEKPMEVVKYTDKKTGTDITEFGSEVLLTGVGAGKLKNMIRTLVDEDIPTIEGKDKAGNPATVEVFDFEDSMKKYLEGKFVMIKISGSGLDTKYIYKSGKEFVTEAPNGELDMSKVPDSGISIEDCPF